MALLDYLNQTNDLRLSFLQILNDYKGLDRTHKRIPIRAQNPFQALDVTHVFLPGFEVCKVKPEVRFANTRELVLTDISPHADAVQLVVLTRILAELPKLQYLHLALNPRRNIYDRLVGEEWQHVVMHIRRMKLEKFTSNLFPHFIQYLSFPDLQHAEIGLDQAGGWKEPSSLVSPQSWPSLRNITWSGCPPSSILFTLLNTPALCSMNIQYNTFDPQWILEPTPQPTLICPSTFTFTSTFLPSLFLSRLHTDGLEELNLTFDLARAPKSTPTIKKTIPAVFPIPELPIKAPNLKTLNLKIKGRGVLLPLQHTIDFICAIEAPKLEKIRLSTPPNLSWYPVDITPTAKELLSKVAALQAPLPEFNRSQPHPLSFFPNIRKFILDVRYDLSGLEWLFEKHNFFSKYLERAIEDVVPKIRESLKDGREDNERPEMSMSLSRGTNRWSIGT